MFDQLLACFIYDFGFTYTKMTKNIKELMSKYNLLQVLIRIWGLCLQGIDLVVGQVILCHNISVRTHGGTKQTSVIFETTLQIILMPVITQN